ncbi:MAG: DUF349 domain-containing protein [Wenzhouxiangellaceae bacterium]|nr:DUF349 domain-containing protein [Wenzhouxiangellaceae bacterium]
MTLKERLFGPPWENKDAAIRARSVASETDRRLLAQLPKIAAEDQDPAVRLAALRRLADEAAWLDARSRDRDSNILAAADQFLLRAACREPAGEHLERRLAWLEHVGAGESLRRIAASGADPELRKAALERIDSPGFLGDRVIGESDDAIADHILARIDQVSTLKRIAGELRKSHKQRQQAVIQRLAALEGDSEEHDARDELAAALISRAEKLARGAFIGDRKTEVERLKAQWSQMTDPDAALARRFEGAIRIAERALSPRPADTPEPSDEPAPGAADAELERLSGQAQQMAAQPAGERTAAALAQMLSAFDRRWNALRSPGPSDRAVRERFQALVGELQARLELQRQRKPEPKADPGPSQAQADQVRALQEALERAEQALASGDIAAAHEAIGTARRLHDRTPQKGRSDRTGSRMARMAGKLKEMRDWQHWSNNELRERLIERVGEIDAENLHPDAVTDRLKELRQRWKELDEHEVLPGDKRRFAAPKGQWRRFQRACKEAFDAAKPYLEKRSEVREQSLQELQQFLDDARCVAADESSSRDKLIRYQRAAREGIRNLDALPPKARGKAASALRELMDAISAALDRHFDVVENEKRRLVAESRKLAHEKDRAVAIDRAKALQAEWKKAGRGRRKTDDQLWNEFREPIDPLFEELRHVRDERRQAEHQHTEVLKDLCTRAEALVDAEDPESVAGQVTGLEEEFQQHTTVPPALRNRFQQALDRCRTRIREARDARARARIGHLVALGEHLQSAWERLLAGQAQPSPEALPGDADDDALDKRLRERLERFLTASDPDELRAEVERLTGLAHQVVIEMECLSGVESPDQDRQLRMDYQISRLSNRLGEGGPRADLDTERSELQRRWLESFPHDRGQHSGLKKRFEKADEILNKMASG